MIKGRRGSICRMDNTLFQESKRLMLKVRKWLRNG